METQCLWAFADPGFGAGLIQHSRPALRGDAAVTHLGTGTPGEGINATSQHPGFMGTPGAGVTGKNASLACLAFLSAPSLMESVGDLDSNPDATTF